MKVLAALMRHSLEILQMNDTNGPPARTRKNTHEITIGIAALNLDTALAGRA